jgi:hypothetical protein
MAASENMMFADDIALCGNAREVVEKKTEDWRRVMEETGFKVNRNKTEYMVFNDVSEKSISMQDYELKKVKIFKYLGSTLSGNGVLMMKWKRGYKQGG